MVIKQQDSIEVARKQPNGTWHIAIDDPGGTGLGTDQTRQLVETREERQEHEVPQHSQVRARGNRGRHSGLGGFANLALLASLASELGRDPN
jgi:hypothetical protein